MTFLGGPIFRLKGSILAMSFLDCNGGLIPYSYESWRDENKRDSKHFSPLFDGKNLTKFWLYRNAYKSYKSYESNNEFKWLWFW